MFSFFTTLKALFHSPRPSSRPLSRADRAARGVGRPHSPAAPKRAASQHLLDAARQRPDALLRAYNSSTRGLNSAQIPALRRRHGENRLTRSRREPLPLRLLRAFLNPFSVVLLLLAAISFITDYLLAAAGEKDLTAVLIVGGMVLISGTLRFVQEARSGDAVARLESLVNTTIDVLRDGRGGERPISELVPGDVVRLAAGDMIPADLRILEAKDLFISQSSLTGESEPVEKFAGLPDASPEAPASPPQSPLDCADLAFMGSNVVSGSALALVLAVGNATLFGSLARQIADTTTRTSFDKGVSAVSWLLIRFMACMVPIVFFINGFTKGDWVEAALFALSVAVGLTPEMLPTVVSANLVRGAAFMARKKVIVRRLDAIQNLGAMDVLCTDKTGTLTRDKIILEYSLDVHGNEDERVLRHAFLNSWFQTGLKNLLDVAIVDHADDLDMLTLRRDYVKVDEIPFDFGRRRMSVVVADHLGKTRMITKGALEEMLAVCAWAEYHGQVEPLTPKLREEILARTRRYNADGLRVLGVARKTLPDGGRSFSVADEADMVLMGYLAFLDPPKESAAQAVAALAAASADYAGLTIDFEGLKGDTIKLNYVTFLKELDAVLPQGKTLYVCVQPDTWYTGFDYRGIGEAADKVILMAHDYQWTSVPDSYVGTTNTDSPVTPFASVYEALRDLTDPATGVADRSKLALQISFGSAGFHVDGEDRLLETTIYHPAPSTLALRLAQPDTQVVYSEEFRNPCALYTTEDGSRYKVWYENEQSVLDKVALARMFGITGVSLWRIGNIPADGTYDVWSALLTQR